MVAKITVDSEQVIGKIHPHIYGHFIEHLGRCIYGGVWAEMLKNRKFFSQYGNAPVRWVDSNEDGVVDPWFSIGKNENTYFTHDNTTFYSGGQLQRLDINEADGQEHGIGQAGLMVQKDREYVGRFVIKCQSVRVSERQSGKAAKQQRNTVAAGFSLRISLKISLRKDNEIIYEKEIKIEEGGWKTYKFHLKPNADCNDAQLCLVSTGPGTIWFGAVSLMPADNIHGMRRDVIELIKQIKPSIIRWPGGNFASGYHWKDGIGDSDKRPTRWDYAWNAIEYNDFGTDEYLQFCKEIGCEPLICINAGSLGTVKEAAEWVSYCKGKVKYWDIGNEMFGNWQLGHVDSETFANKTLKLIKAMRKVDRGIKVVGCGAVTDTYNHWNDPIIEIAGKELDYLSIHDYTGSDLKDEIQLYHSIVGAPSRIEKMLKDTITYVSKLSPEKKIPIAFDEWNVWLPEASVKNGMEMTYTLRDGIYAAGIFHVLHRLSDNIKMANLAQLVNVLGVIHTDQIKVIATPLHTAFQLYINRTGEESLKVDTESPSFAGVPYEGVPYIDCSATRSTLDASVPLLAFARKQGGETSPQRGGRRTTLYLAIINRHPSEQIECQISLKGFPPVTAAGGRRAIAFQMNADSFNSKEAVISEFTMSGLSSYFTQSFPPHSVTIIEMEY